MAVVQELIKALGDNLEVHVIRMHHFLEYRRYRRPRGQPDICMLTKTHGGDIADPSVIKAHDC
jgi:hypothetical protein